MAHLTPSTPSRTAVYVDDAVRPFTVRQVALVRCACTDARMGSRVAAVCVTDDVAMARRMRDVFAPVDEDGAPMDDEVSAEILDATGAWVRFTRAPAAPAPDADVPF